MVTTKTGHTLQNAIWALGNAPFNWSSSLWVSGSGREAGWALRVPPPPTPRGCPRGPHPARRLLQAAALYRESLERGRLWGDVWAGGTYVPFMPLVCAPSEWETWRWPCGFCFLASQRVVFRDIWQDHPPSPESGLAEERGAAAPRPGARAEVSSAHRALPRRGLRLGLLRRAPEAGSARTQGASGCTWSAGAENRGDISAKVILKKWFFLILPFKNTLGGSLRLGCGLRTMNRIRGPDSQFVGFGLVSLSFMPLGNAAVVKEGEDERGRKWVCKWGRKVCKEGGNECVSEAAMGPVQGLVSAFPSACAMD